MRLGESGWKDGVFLYQIIEALIVIVTISSKITMHPASPAASYQFNDCDLLDGGNVGGWMSVLDRWENDWRDAWLCACIDKRIDEEAIMTTHCPDCRSFSFTTAQLVSESSSVGHRAACMVCEEKEEEKRSKMFKIGLTMY